MSSDVMIPDLPGAPSKRFVDLGVKTEHLGEGLDGMGFSMVGISGKEFYVNHRGQKKTLVSPAHNPPQEGDGYPVKYFDFIILRKGARKSHTWYAEGYKSGAEERPDCVSTDGIAPDDNSKSPQSTLCDLCPRYEWKKLANGRDGRECQDSLRLAVLPVATSIRATLGVTINEPVLFRIPAASLKAFSQLGEALNQRYGEAPFCSFVLRVRFKVGVEHPQFEYQVLKWLSDAEADIIAEMRESPIAYRILGLTPGGQSLVRKQMVAVGTVARPEVARIVQPPASAVGRQPTTIDVEAEHIQPNPPQVQPSPPNPPHPALKLVVADAPPDMDALVTAMRPQPPKT